MRFLIFNLVVVGSLFYLFNGGQLPETGDGVLHKTSIAAQNTLQAGRKATAAIMDKVMQTEAAKPVASVPVAPVPVKLAPVKAAPIEVAVRQTVPPIPVTEKISAPRAPAIKPAAQRTAAPNLIPPAIHDPAVQKRRAEVMATGPTKYATDQTAFMSPQQRRKELHALSEEMELLFASSRIR